MSTDRKIILGVLLISFVLLVSVVVAGNKQSKRLNIPLAGIQEEDLGANHVSRGSINKTNDPRTSGDHYGDGVAGPGIHDEEVDDGLLIHSMEHGAVILHYNPDLLSEEEISSLKEIFIKKFKGKKIMVPRSGMSKPIIMTSWGQKLELDGINEDEMINFMNTNNDRGPEKSPLY